MPLTISHAAGPDQPEIRELTLGGLLTWAADDHPDRVALISGVARPSSSPAVDVRRAVRRIGAHRARAAATVRTGRTRRGVGAQHSRVDHDGVRRRVWPA